MERLFYQDLLKWKQDGHQKPMMVIGARQTGKTYLINEFCKQEYANYIYINLEKQEAICSLFDETLDPLELKKSIGLLLNRSILPDTIIFFDEIQVSERAITSLKYFCEEDKDNPIICAGSLLGVKLSRFQSSFPVGKIIIKDMYPLNFKEFLMACQQTPLIDKIIQCYKERHAMPTALHERALTLYKEFLVLGGMPEVIKSYIEQGHQVNAKIRELQEMINIMYLADMNKYTQYSEGIKNEAIYQSIPAQLAKENSKFKYSVVDKAARSRQYNSSLQWLLSSRILLQTSRINKIEKPLRAFEDKDYFKVYLNDTGLLMALANYDYREILLNRSHMFSGAMSENYVASQFAQAKIPTHYYTFSKYEIDFIISTPDKLIPIEVKAGTNTRLTSLRAYIDKYKCDFAMVICMKNFGFEQQIYTIPFYAMFALCDDINAM